MEGDKRIDELMLPVLNSINRHVKDRDAKTDIYNRAYEAVINSIDVNVDTHLNDKVSIDLQARIAELTAKLAALREQVHDLERDSAWTGVLNSRLEYETSRLMVENSALREQVRWILVSERLPEEEYIFSDWYKSLSEHIELFAAAFAKATNLNPREIKMVQKTTSDGMKIWFEPFPDGSEIEMYRSRAELAEKQLAALREQVRWRN